MATSSLTAHIVMSNPKGANALVYALAGEKPSAKGVRPRHVKVLAGADGLRALRRTFGCAKIARRKAFA